MDAGAVVVSETVVVSGAVVGRVGMDSETVVDDGVDVDAIVGVDVGDVDAGKDESS